MNTLKDIFVSYEIAEKLKEIGFNEPCIGYYEKENPHIRLNEDRHKTIKHNGLLLYISAPTYEQIFKWFRENNIDACIDIYQEIEETSFYYNYTIYDFRKSYGGYEHYKKERFETYEQAREQLILKLIKIYKNEK